MIPFPIPRLALATLAVSLTLPATLWAGLEVEVLYDHAADFSAFETYRWVTAPLSDSPEARMVDERIKTTADAELAKSGLRRAAEGEEADLLVTYYGGIEDNLLIEGVRFELAPHVVWTGADPLGVTHRYQRTIFSVFDQFVDAGAEATDDRGRCRQRLDHRVGQVVD